MTSIATCDDCGGPAWWKVDPRGDVWYSCQARCDGFSQTDMFSDLAPVDLPGPDDVVRLDSIGSVSGLRRDEAPYDLTTGSQGLCSCDLPF